MANEEKNIVSEGRWARLKKEITPNKELIPIKLIIFFFVAGIGAFLPYCTLHMKEVGLTMQEIAIIYAFIPAASFIGPCFSGMIADKLSNYTVTLAINMLLCALFHTLLLVVPFNQSNIDLNHLRSDQPLSFACDQQGFRLLHNVSSRSPFQIKERVDLNSLKNCIGHCEGSSNTTQICLNNADDGIEASCFMRSLSVEFDFQSMIPMSVTSESLINLTCSSLCQLDCENKSSSADNYNPYREGIASSSLTFYLYFFLRTFGSMTMCSSFTMLDSVVLAKLNEGVGDFGKQRIMTMLGQAFAPLLSGILVDRLNVGNDAIDYSFAFYIGDILLLLAAFISFGIKLQVDQPSQNMVKDVVQIMKRAESDIFLVTVTVLGMNWGFLETYLFVYLTEIGAPIYLLGITLTVGMCSGIPLLYISDMIVEKVGRHAVFLLSFTAYAVRFVGYSLITNAWMCLPFEVLEVITYQLMWVAAAMYCPILAPKGLLATMTCIAGAAHYSLGRGIGAFLGGNLILWYGTVKAFTIFGYLSAAGGLCYLAIYYGYLKNIANRKVTKEYFTNEESKEESKNMI